MGGSEAVQIVERLHEAILRRDLAAFLACFAPDYRSVQPLQPVDSFEGAAMLRQRWASAFEGVATLHAELLRSIADEHQVWTEWAWTGVWSNGTPFGVRGVTIFGVDGGAIVWGRLYLVADDYSSGRRSVLPF